MASDVDKQALSEGLKNLETRLEAYLLEWQRQLGLPKRPCDGIDPKERPPVGTEWAKKGR